MHNPSSDSRPQLLLSLPEVVCYYPVLIVNYPVLPSKYLTGQLTGQLRYVLGRRSIMTVGTGQLTIVNWPVNWPIVSIN